ncbi:CK1/TTBKL protein kinase [Aphelenchoides avenae]|nr:CK1/TTBKL protein kinase [Aphelenchus avenae]
MENSEDKAPFDLREGQVIAKRWVVAEELGKGSCGKVYRVHDVNNRRKRAALKIELIDDNTPSVLKQEVQVLQKLQSRKHDAHKMKREVRDEVLTAYCPPEWTMILKHVRKLEFDERPDYRHVYDLLLKAMTRLKVSFTEPYEWENAKRLSNGSASSTSSIGKKKSSAQSKNDKATKAASAEKTKLKETSAEPSEAPADSETPPTAAPEEFARNDIGI